MAGSPQRPGWRAAWSESSGPEGLAQILVLALKGFAMGCADIVPGVSGGTIAFITNVYDPLIRALKSFDSAFARRLLRLDLPGALAVSHLRFLLPLGLGILTALMLASRMIHSLLADYPVLVWSFFFGLIAASIVVVGRRVKRPGWGCAAALAGGALFAYGLVGLIPVATPETWWFIMFSGALAICAMILPGISGAFILLLLGKYEYITRTLKNPFALDNFLVIVLFAGGCVLGLLGFSRLLDRILSRRHDATVSALTGFMAGALRKVWPFKEVLETKVVAGRELAVRSVNVLPTHLNAETLQAVALMALGLALVLALDRISRRA
jgi:putative membrane protein